MTRSQLAEEELIRDGWTYDRSATSRGYRPAGKVEEMARRGGYDYCRVYTSECRGRQKWQITNIYKKEVEA